MSDSPFASRHTEQAIASAGFSIEHVERESMCKAPAIVRPTIRGVAVKKARVARHA